MMRSVPRRIFLDGAKVKMVRPAHADPVNSVDLFDRTREGYFGGAYCVAAAILPSEVDEHWSRYIAGITARPEDGSETTQEEK